MVLVWPANNSNLLSWYCENAHARYINKYLNRQWQNTLFLICTGQYPKMHLGDALMIKIKKLTDLEKMDCLGSLCLCTRVCTCVTTLWHACGLQHCSISVLYTVHIYEVKQMAPKKFQYYVLVYQKTHTFFDYHRWPFYYVFESKNLDVWFATLSKCWYSSGWDTTNCLRTWLEAEVGCNILPELGRRSSREVLGEVSSYPWWSSGRRRRSKFPKHITFIPVSLTVRMFRSLL